MNEYEPALRKAAALAEAAALLLGAASEEIRQTRKGPQCLAGFMRTINYWLCSARDEANRLNAWIEDELSGASEFCEHGQPAHIVKAGLCDQCERKLFRVCMVCEKITSQRADYMVKRAVWREADWQDKKGTTHLPCLQEKLGRPLTLDDFDLTLPINKDMLWALENLKDSAAFIAKVRWELESNLRMMSGRVPIPIRPDGGPDHTLLVMRTFDSLDAVKKVMKKS